MRKPTLALGQEGLRFRSTPSSPPVRRQRQVGAGSGRRLLGGGRHHDPELPVAAGLGLAAITSEAVPTGITFRLRRRALALGPKV